MYSFQNNVLRAIQASVKSVIKYNNIGNEIRFSYFHTVATKKCLPTTCLVQIKKEQVQSLHTYSPTVTEKVLHYVKQKWHKLRNFNNQKELLVGLALYQSLEHVKFSEFFSTFKLPDTFLSWFLVSELHVWMLLVRLQQEGMDGRIVRNSILESFYEDAFRRAALLAPLDSVKAKKQVMELCHDLKVALVLYDEGLLNDDKALAGALWYHFFKTNCDDLRDLEVLVQYIRHQVKILKNWSTLDILEYNRSTCIWTPLKPHVKNVYSS